MSYDLITNYKSGNYSPGRPYGAPNHITIHWWGDPKTKPTFDGVARYLCRKNGTSSAHYVAEAGRVAMLVDPKNRAWHAGNESNPRGIGIECNPRCSAADRETVAELIADIRRTYGNLPLRMHKQFMTTACPGVWANHLAWLDDRANAILASKTTAKKKTSSKSIETLAREVIAGKHGNGAARKKALGAQYAAVQKRVNDILAGKTTSPAKSIETLAREVIAGKYGNGEARKKALGSQYSAVQKRVNAILGGN